MSYSSIINNAAIKSQSILAQMQGQAQNASGNFLYAMEVGQGVFGAAQVVEIPQAGGGYRRRVQLNLTVTRDQEFSFEAKTKLVRLSTDAAHPAITYVIDDINTHDPLAWTLVLVKAGT